MALGYKTIETIILVIRAKIALLDKYENAFNPENFGLIIISFVMSR